MKTGTVYCAIRDYFFIVYNKRDLLWHLIKRDITNRYKGSFIGVVWSIINPMLLLIVYTFVFSVILKAKWGLPGEGRLDFAIALFCGMILFNAYADASNRAPTLVLDNKNYVKKVIFPLEILPIVPVSSSFFSGLISLIILMATVTVVHGFPGSHMFLLPLLWVPLYLMTLGVCLLISSLGVYIRDLSQVVSLFNMVFMFLSAIFFPIERIPEIFRNATKFNPLAELVTQTRAILIFSKPFDWIGYGQSILVSIIVLFIGIITFHVLKKGFADVV